MWSDPPATLAGALCFNICFEDSVDRLNALLEAPANDEVPVQQLVNRARGESIRDNVVPYLNARGLEHYPLDTGKAPGFTECEPLGFAREFLHHTNWKLSSSRIT